MTAPRMEVSAWVARLHAVVDELTVPLLARHAPHLACRRGCSGCCTDDLTVFEVEAALIVERHAALLTEGEPHAPGACAFLDSEGACRIYASRPYVCRTQGLPLRWLEDGDEPFEARDVCPENLGVGALEDLSAEECWTLGPIEQRLAAWQAAHGTPGERVSLRTLFASASGGGSGRRLPVVR